MKTLSEVKELFNSNRNVQIEFTKKNGKLRKMKCTRDWAYLNENNKDFSYPTNTRSYKNENIIIVWDVEKSAYRSFDYNSLKSIEVYN